MVYNVSENASILNVFLSEIRNVDIQTDPMRFRRNMERIAEVMAYELSKKFNYELTNVQTPLGNAEIYLPDEKPVLATILRAGLSMHQGLLNYFDRSESAFVSAYREHINENEFEIKVDYLASPKIDNKVLIISDPMLATGNSMINVFKALLQQGNPKKVIIVTAIATPSAIELVKKQLPASSEIWVAAIDAELTAQSYIVPGLGDAGDLAYGEKC
ncbi:MAG: uracil phosphoribosyltransferase [Crocinitomicaceae bacterium]|nr:uracil phosphoribosyltransferase [Crocinitomicaceae bacterium]